jgi:hypothetical protein
MIEPGNIGVLTNTDRMQIYKVIFTIGQRAYIRPLGLGQSRFIDQSDFWVLIPFMP